MHWALAGAQVMLHIECGLVQRKREAFQEYRIQEDQKNHNQPQAQKPQFE